MEKYKNFIQKYIFKISAPTWNEEFGLPDGSYSISNIKEYFEYIFKNMEKRLMITISFHTFKIKTRYYLELLTPETMKLFESTKIEITKDENGKNVPHLEMSEVVLVHCNIVKNSYQHDSRAKGAYVYS